MSQLTLINFIGLEDIKTIPLSPTCKYLSCRAAGDSEIISEASLRAPEAFFSPSAAITFVMVDYFRRHFISRE